MKTRWWLVLCLGLAGASGQVIEREAAASISIEMSFDALLRDSSAAVVGTCAEQRAVWEGNRIYTYSRVHVDTPIAGELHEGDDAWVRTMGGIVGKVGQVVDGEASMTVGEPSLLFLRRSTVAGYAVTGRAQGQFGLHTDEHAQVRLHKTSARGGLFAPHGPDAAGTPAGAVLHGRLVTEATGLIASAWDRAHAR
jgi:hypothetical protein